MSNKRKPSKRKVKTNQDQGYEKLEPRHLLAAISDPFADNAVSVQDMLQRAQTTPYMQGEIVVAVQTDTTADQAPAVVDNIDWDSLIGSDATPIKTLMSIDRDAGQSVTLVHLQLSEDGKLAEAMQNLDQVEMVMWSSPNFYVEGEVRDYTPNDPDYVNQYHHELMQTDHAWDITFGDAEILVGITDDGVELDHEDLQNIIWVNDGEIAGNGIDDDGNGYVDDVNGWDFSSDDNDPNPQSNFDSHGTHVAGITAAETDNGLGVAGVSRSTILPLQFYGGSNAWTAALINETFAYAADNGAHIVNTSYRIDQFWGDPVFTAGLQYMHDNNVLHFNSAGNGFSLNTARQNFDQTLLVANTDSADQKNASSNYGYGVDISSPGTDILSSVTGNGYDEFTGTSMAAPDAAGVAALIWSHNPTWTNVQVAAQLLATADYIDDVNPGLEGWLGSGRTNSFRALTETLPAPQVSQVLGLPGHGEAEDNTSINSFTLRFNQIIDLGTANDIRNYDLRAAGEDGIFDTADDVLVGLSPEEYMIGTNDFEFDITSGDLEYGQYRLTISNLNNAFGLAMDGDGDGLEGDAYVHDFWLLKPTAAHVTVGESKYAVADTVQITLHDDNLAGTNPLVTVTTSAGDTEVVTLSPAGSGRWTGSIDTQQGVASTGDGIANVMAGEVLTVSYFDSDDGDGGTFASSASATITSRIDVPSTDPPVTIDDTGTVVSTIDVGLVGQVSDVNVRVDITHPRVSDLSLALVSPGNVRVPLAEKLGGVGSDYSGTYFDDEATNSINDAGAPFRGRYQPMGELGDIVGGTASGIWRLEITDDVTGQVGVLNDWSLSIDLAQAVRGTPGDDVIIVHFGQPMVTVNVNGDITEVERESGGFVFDALGGNDKLTVFADDGDDQIVIRDNLFQLSGAFSFIADSVEDVRAFGGGGVDTARVYGTRGDDVFRTFAVGASLVGDGYQYVVRDFERVNAFGQTGNDTANLIDTEGDDVFFANEVFANLAGGDGTRINARDFDVVNINATQGGYDYAQFVGSDGSDSLFATPEMATFMTGLDEIRVIGFDRTWANAQGGDDTARFIGSDQDDRFNSRPDQSYLFSDGYFNQGLGFEEVIADAGGGNDMAILLDTHGDDDLFATPHMAIMNSPNLMRQANGFEHTSAIGSAGFDRAIFEDSAGDDRFVTRPASAFMIGEGFLNFVQRFNSVNSTSTGGDDIAIFYASSQDDRFHGSQAASFIQGSTFFNRALNYGSVTAYLTGPGIELATLEDSSNDDSLIARDNKAVLYNDDYFIQVYGADEMFVTSKHGGTNKLFAANDLAFELGVIGEWEDF